MQDAGVLLSEQVTKMMMANHISVGHILAADSWYIAPEVVKWLQDNDTGFVGTVNTLSASRAAEAKSAFD